MSTIQICLLESYSSFFTSTGIIFTIKNTVQIHNIKYIHNYCEWWMNISILLVKECN